jgi:hypothetical protein
MDNLAFLIIREYDVPLPNAPFHMVHDELVWITNDYFNCTKLIWKRQSPYPILMDWDSAWQTSSMCNPWRPRVQYKQCDSVWLATIIDPTWPSMGLNQFLWTCERWQKWVESIDNLLWRWFNEDKKQARMLWSNGKSKL